MRLGSDDFNEGAPRDKVSSSYQGANPQTPEAKKEKKGTPRQRGQASRNDSVEDLEYEHDGSW
eukprot:CAMPEP_0184299556 /NCGR_PEP_ID=MMETSP1049-20130417/10143_1 /TAXON_ID=77928 /ORGANISM="Proteomonas sulcata, Strain CCMP704" /LENGTH=62 /DNA_ID=CAMNT_0026610027 /DNA_START=175 /DNA_END=360 /DNA_ORIENTATION=+